MIKKYTYKDWWEGKIYLAYCNVLYHQSDREKIICAYWADFSETDSVKIKTKQRKLYDAKLNELLNVWSKLFSENYSRSELKDIFLADEINDIENILFNKHKNYQRDNYELAGNYYITLHLKNRPASFTVPYLSKVREYTEYIFKRGKAKKFDFIHSPNFPYQDKDNIAQPEVYAQVCWDYLKWLKEFFPKINKKLSGETLLKDFPDFLIHESKVQFANKLKEEFSTEKGMGLKLMTQVLEEKSRLIVPGRQMKKFFQSMKLFFNRDIGAYSGFNDWKFIEAKHGYAYKKTLARIDIVLASTAEQDVN